MIICLNKIPILDVKIRIKKKKPIPLSVTLFISKTRHQDFTRSKTMSCMWKSQSSLLSNLFRIYILIQRWSPRVFLCINRINATRSSFKQTNKNIYLSQFIIKTETYKESKKAKRIFTLVMVTQDNVYQQKHHHDKSYKSSNQNDVTHHPQKALVIYE